MAPFENHCRISGIADGYHNTGFRLVTFTPKKRTNSGLMPRGFVSFALAVVRWRSGSKVQGDRNITSLPMNVRTATVLEADKDVQAPRPAARGILIAASNLRAADSTDLKSRAAKVAAIAAAHSAAVDGDSRFPKEAIAAARAERLLGIAVPREFAGEGARIGDVVD